MTQYEQLSIFMCFDAVRKTHNLERDSSKTMIQNLLFLEIPIILRCAIVPPFMSSKITIIATTIICH